MSRARAWAWGAAFASVALLRLYYCTVLPRSTGDLPRHLFHGLYVARDGLASAGTPLASHSSYLSGVAWAELPYNYPVVALAFFTLVAALSPTLFFAKLALTLVDALAAAIIHRHTGRPLLALLYWAAPSSIWWVSGEGQFEPVQSLFVVAAIHALPRSAPLAFALLALGIQTKLTSAALVPGFALALLAHGQSREQSRAVAAFALAFVPSAVAALAYPLLPSLAASATTHRYNPYWWNVFDRAPFAWSSGWMIGLNALVSYGLLGVLLIAALRSGRAAGPYLAPLLLMLFCKLSPLCQHWYMLSFMPLFLAIERPRLRTALFVAAPLLDPLGPLQLVFGPIGFVADPGYYDNLTAFTPLTLP